MSYQGETHVQILERENNELQAKLAAAEADEATCHCGQRLSQHYTATEHAAVEMSHPCPHSEWLAAAEAENIRLLESCKHTQIERDAIRAKLAEAEAVCVKLRNTLCWVHRNIDRIRDWSGVPKGVVLVVDHIQAEIATETTRNTHGNSPDVTVQKERDVSDD